MLLLALLAPFVFALARSPDAGAPLPFGDFSELEGSEHEAYERELRELLKSEAPSKIAFLRLKMSGATYPLFALSDLRVPIVLDGHIPATNFKHLVHDRSARSLHACLLLLVLKS